MRRLDELPEDVLCTIFEHFVARAFTAPVLRPFKWGETAQDHATLASLCLVNRCIARIARPLFWRHCGGIVPARRRWPARPGSDALLVRAAELAGSILPGSPSYLCSSSFVNSLHLSWSLDTDLDCRIIQVIGLCTNLAFLRLHTSYPGIDISPTMNILHAPLQRLSRSLEKLQRIIHLHLGFVYGGYNRQYDAFEQYLAYITAIPLVSLLGLTLEGGPYTALDSTHQATLPVQLSPNLRQSTVYPALTTICFQGNFSAASRYKIMDAFSISPRIDTMSLFRVETDFLERVPDALSISIRNLLVDRDYLIDPTAILKFHMLRTLECPILELCGYLAREERLLGHGLCELEMLRLHGLGIVFVDWAEHYLPDPRYMPKLKHLSIRRITEIGPTPELNLADLVATVAPFRRLEFREE